MADALLYIWWFAAGPMGENNISEWLSHFCEDNTYVLRHPNIKKV